MRLKRLLMIGVGFGCLTLVAAQEITKVVAKFRVDGGSKFEIKVSPVVQITSKHFELACESLEEQYFKMKGARGFSTISFVLNGPRDDKLNRDPDQLKPFSRLFNKVDPKKKSIKEGRCYMDRKRYSFNLEITTHTLEQARAITKILEAPEETPPSAEKK